MKNVRIFYRKLGSMKFVSHLDMNRFMSRIIAKSKIPVWYTEGFNQHIYMNFALPLSLGYEGYYEMVDIRLTDDDFSLKNCLEALKNVAVADIEFVSAAEPQMPMKTIGFAKYELTFEDFSFKDSLTDFLNQESILCTKKGKKGKEKGASLVEPNYEGIRINFKNHEVNGWCLLRKSLHDPQMPLNIEVTEGSCQIIMDYLMEYLGAMDLKL